MKKILFALLLSTSMIHGMNRAELAICDGVLALDARGLDDVAFLATMNATERARVHKLKLGDNNLKNINISDLRALFANLEELDLSGNPLKTIEGTAFDTHKLALCATQLSDFAAGTQRSFPADALKNLTLQRLSLLRIKKTVVGVFRKSELSLRDRTFRDLDLGSIRNRIEQLDVASKNGLV